MKGCLVIATISLLLDLNGLTAFWNGCIKDNTRVSIALQEEKLCMTFEVSDKTLYYVDDGGERSVEMGDRVEFYLSKDSEMGEYYCVEISPSGKVMDYKAQHYRKFDYSWNCPFLTVSATVGKDSYRVEVSLPVNYLKTEFLDAEGRLFLGIYRADWQPPLNDFVWYSWINPFTAEPDFHVPSSLIKLELI